MNARPSAENVYTKQQRIAELARQMPDRALTSLHHHIDLEWLLEAWKKTRKDGAAGVDGQTADDYAKNLRGNLSSLLDRFKSGRYRAPPVRGVDIPKGDGRSTRPIGIPTLEDKVLQRAIVMLLEPVYEAMFYDISFGFRHGKSAHNALDHLWQQCTGRNPGKGCAGSWTWIFGRSLTRSTTPACGKCWTSGFETESCAG